jgi:hypothetical protein
MMISSPKATIIRVYYFINPQILGQGQRAAPSIVNACLDKISEVSKRQHAHRKYINFEDFCTLEFMGSRPLMVPLRPSSVKSVVIGKLLPASAQK